MKAKVNVLDDGTADNITGGTELDWYFNAIDEVITDLFAGELIDII